MKVCIKCNNELKGRQIKFCSTKCKRRYYGSYAGPYAKNRADQAIPRKRKLLSIDLGKNR